MAINRLSTGFIFSDNFNRADGAPGANWSVQTGAAAIVGNVLRSSTAGTNVNEVNAARAAVGVAQMRVKTPGSVAGGPTFRHSDDGWSWYIQLDGLGAAFLFYRNTGYNYTGLTVAGFVVPNVFQRVKGSWKAGRFDVWAVDSGKTLGINSVVLDAKNGSGGLHFNNTGNVEIDDYVRYSSNVVSISGLATGQKLKVGTVTVVEDGSGNASVDLGGQYCPITKVEVLNSDNSLFEEYAPGDGVWGGDVYELVAIAPDKPSISVTNLLDTSFTLVGSTYVHSASSPHTETRWVVRDSFGVTVLDDSTIVNLLSRDLDAVDGIEENTNYFAKVAYKEAGGLWSEFSDELHILTRPSVYPALKRTTLGWIYGTDAFSRSAADGDLREKIIDVDLVEMVVQSIMTHTTVNPPASAIAAKWQSANNFYGAQIDSFGNASLYRCIGPGVFDFDIIDNFGFIYLQNDPVPTKLHVRDTFPRQRAWFVRSDGLTLQLTGDDTDLDGLAGDAGIRVNFVGVAVAKNVDYTEYAVYRNNTVTCEGLPSGYSSRLKDQLGNVLFTDPALGGTTTRDIQHNLCPLVIEVLDELGAVVFTRSDVWGGDIYEYVDAPLTPSQRRTLERAWMFNLDGHVFYVLNFTLAPALIYDLTSDQWYRWYRNESLGPGIEPYWNMFRGHVWKGRVLAADMETADIWELDPHSFLDDEILPIVRKATGFQQLRGSASVRQGALRIIARRESDAASATLTMRFSDDGGKTWSTDRTVTLTPGSLSQRVEFRSLGRIRAPGRLWEIEDSGGFVRIEGADADLEGGE